MKSKITANFRKLYRQLSPETRRAAHEAYLKWLQDPTAAGLNFKRVNDTLPIYSARIGRQYRALGVLKGDTVTWYWIGKHDEYDRLLR